MVRAWEGRRPRCPPFRTNETAFVQTKRKLLDDCDLWCIVSLPGGVFTAAGAGVKTNLLFFNKGQPTQKIWYYDLSHIKVGKKTPLTLAHFEEFFRLLAQRADSERSWTVNMMARREKAKAEADPLRAQAGKIEADAAPLREQIKKLKAEKKTESPEFATIGEKLATLECDARELKAKAQAIEDSAYDLKAVNPNAKNEEDTRTPEELLAVIEAKGHEVSEALANLTKRGET